MKTARATAILFIAAITLSACDLHAGRLPHGSALAGSGIDTPTACATQANYRGIYAVAYRRVQMAS